jgi:uroporphyrinogen decarboxylase
MKKSEYLEFLKKNRDRTLPIFTYPIANSLGINPYDLTVDSHKHAKVLKYIDDLADFGFVTGLMDLSIEAEAFGCPLEIDKINLPTIGPKVIETINDAKAMNIPEIERFRTSIYIDSMMTIDRIIDDKPILATVVSPFTLAGILLGIYDTTEHLKNNHELIYIVLENVSIFLKSYYKALLSAGADGLLICDSMAGVLDHSNFDQFSTIFLNQILDDLDEEKYILYHNCGEVEDTIESIKNIHADIYHFGDCNDLESILKTFPKNKLVMGNVSPINTFKKKNHKRVERATHSLLKKCNKYENFLISPGCDLPSNISFEKIVSYLKTIDKYYTK